jgi:thiamine-monophosphate kinase
MDEFQLIDRLIEILGENVRGPHILLGPGDDAALIETPPGCVVAASIDTLVGGVHFPLDAPADLVGFRALGVSVSDLAAMGANPAYVLIALTLPDGSDEWIERFAHGVAAAASRFRVAVAGGNLARGPVNIGVSVHGHVARGEALMRAGARPNDLVCVSGQLGGAAAALSRADLSSPPPLSTLLAVAANDALYPLRRYYLPEPRIELGRTLRGLATAAIDISDGLVADLGHLCAASAVAGEIDLEDVPVVAGVEAQLAATGGDDYELCFTIAPRDRGRLPDSVTVVGRIAAGAGVVVRSRGAPVQLARRGFDHFR